MSVASLDLSPNPLPRGRRGAVAAIDIGTTKVCCVIARASGADDVEVLGIGHQASQGVKAGTLTDMAAAAQAITEAVQAAERRAHATVERVVASLNGPSVHVIPVTETFALNGSEVMGDALKRLLQRAAHNALYPGQSLVHLSPAGYTLDGLAGITDPTGMVGDNLSVHLQAIRATEGAVRNVEGCLARLHLAVEGMCAAGLASALAVLTEDERQLGATLIDMGGATTNVVAFEEGQPILIHGLSVGGQHVTNDVARGLSTPIEAAERLKVLSGSALETGTDDRDLIDIPALGRDQLANRAMPRTHLNGIIRPRLEETFEYVRDVLDSHGLRRVGGRRVVLTGGACQLPGTLDLATQVLGKTASIGRPSLGNSPLPRDLDSPAMAGVVGLIHYALGRPPHPPLMPGGLATGRRGLVGRMAGWVQTHF